MLSHHLHFAEPFKFRSISVRVGAALTTTNIASTAQYFYTGLATTTQVTIIACATVSLRSALPYRLRHLRYPRKSQKDRYNYTPIYRNRLKGAHSRQAQHGRPAF